MILGFKVTILFEIFQLISFRNLEISSDTTSRAGKRGFQWVFLGENYIFRAQSAVPMSERTVFPKELLYKGLSVMILETPLPDFTRAWVDVVDFNMERVFGIFDCPALPELHTQKVEFHVSEILTCRGTLEWNIEHLCVSCSEKVVSGERIGYFYNAIIERPLHYGRVYYSISEINEKKSNIKLLDVPLSNVIKLDDGIVPYLKEFSYFGYLRNSKNGFEDLSHHDLDSQNIFTSAIQRAYLDPI